MPNVTRKLNAENSQFSMQSAAHFGMTAGADAKTRRQFSGVAYSGEVIKKHWYWGDVVFDLHSMSVPSKLPALIDHDRGARCGYVLEHDISENAGLTVKGNLLSNTHGAAVAAESDEGFPWQMSVHIEPGSVEEVMSGSTVAVNGRSFAGPITVFRNSKIAEVSFTATGWDSNTSAAAMSRGGDSSHNPIGESSMDLQAALARVAELEAEKTSLQASNTSLTSKVDTLSAELTKFSSDARTAAVTQLFSDIGRPAPEAGKEDSAFKQFCEMPAEAFAATASIMRDQAAKAPATTAAPALPSGLFGHVATDGQALKPAPSGDVNPLLADAQNRATTFSKRTS
jgi:hypothetical protein